MASFTEESNQVAFQSKTANWTEVQKSEQARNQNIISHILKYFHSKNYSLGDVAKILGIQSGDAQTYLKNLDDRFNSTYHLFSSGKAHLCEVIQTPDMKELNKYLTNVALEDFAQFKMYSTTDFWDQSDLNDNIKITFVPPENEGKILLDSCREIDEESFLRLIQQEDLSQYLFDEKQDEGTPLPIILDKQFLDTLLAELQSTDATAIQSNPTLRKHIYSEAWKKFINRHEKVSELPQHEESVFRDASLPFVEQMNHLPFLTPLQASIEPSDLVIEAPGNIQKSEEKLQETSSSDKSNEIAYENIATSETLTQQLNAVLSYLPSEPLKETMVESEKVIDNRPISRAPSKRKKDKKNKSDEIKKRSKTKTQDSEENIIESIEMDIVEQLPINKISYKHFLLINLLKDYKNIENLITALENLEQHAEHIEELSRSKQKKHDETTAIIKNHHDENVFKEFFETCYRKLDELEITLSLYEIVGMRHAKKNNAYCVIYNDTCIAFLDFLKNDYQSEKFKLLYAFSSIDYSHASFVNHVDSSELIAKLSFSESTIKQWYDLEDADSTKTTVDYDKSKLIARIKQAWEVVKIRMEKARMVSYKVPDITDADDKIMIGLFNHFYHPNFKKDGQYKKNVLTMFGFHRKLSYKKKANAYVYLFKDNVNKIQAIQYVVDELERFIIRDAKQISALTPSEKVNSKLAKKRKSDQTEKPTNKRKKTVTNNDAIDEQQALGPSKTVVTSTASLQDETESESLKLIKQFPEIDFLHEILLSNQDRLQVLTRKTATRISFKRSDAAKIIACLQAFSEYMPKKMAKEWGMLFHHSKNESYFQVTFYPEILKLIKNLSAQTSNNSTGTNDLVRLFPGLDFTPESVSKNYGLTSLRELIDKLKSDWIVLESKFALSKKSINLYPNDKNDRYDGSAYFVKLYRHLYAINGRNAHTIFGFSRTPGDYAENDMCQFRYDDKTKAGKVEAIEKLIQLLEGWYELNQQIKPVAETDQTNRPLQNFAGTPHGLFAQKSSSLKDDLNNQPSSINISFHAQNKGGSSN